MREFVGVLQQVGYGQYESSYTPVKGRHREDLQGYLVFYSSAGAGWFLDEWTRLSLTLFIRDKGGNSSNKVVLPLVIYRGAKQELPPPPFDGGGLDNLGVLWFDLIEPELDSEFDEERVP
jgi:hypothetical protein